VISKKFYKLYLIDIWNTKKMGMGIRIYLLLGGDVNRSKVTTKNSNITWEFSCKFVEKICKKRLFSAIFSKNFN